MHSSLIYLTLRAKNEGTSAMQKMKKVKKVRYQKNLKQLTKIKTLEKYEGIQEKRRHLNKI